MLKIENFEVMGWEHAIRGMRNPMNSWEQSDSGLVDCESTACEHCVAEGEDNCSSYCLCYYVGPNDLNLMKNLRTAGTDHRKYMRMLTVYLDITAPLYWWKEFDTYKVGTVANSCSTMHKIHAKEFTLEDFSHEHLMVDPLGDTSDVPLIAVANVDDAAFDPVNILELTVNMLNAARLKYLECAEALKHNNFETWNDGMDCKTLQKHYWWQIIQLLPSSYNQKRTVMLNYEVLANIYKSRRNHKLDEWHVLCNWIEKLPYAELITGKFEEK